MSTQQIATSVSILNSLKGFQALTLSNPKTSAATVITDGGIVEIVGAFFRFTVDETPQASTWAAVATGATAYLTLLPTGGAGVQTLVTRWTDTAPEWNDTRQGWYTSAGSTIRHIGGCHKGGAASYQNKFILGAERVGGVSISGDDIAWNPAGDAEVRYDLSANEFVFNKWVKRPVRIFTSANAIQQDVFNALDEYIPTTAETIIMSGAGSIPAGDYNFIAAYVTRISATLIHIFGSEATTVGQSTPHLICDQTNSTGGPASNASSIAYTQMTISW